MRKTVLDKRIAIDVDGVVANLIHDIVSRRSQELLDRDLSHDKITNYNCSSFFGFDSIGEMLSYIINNNLLERATVIPGSAEALRRFHYLGFGITAITARGYHEFADVITAQWFNKNEIPVDRILISGNDKLEVFEQLEGKYELYVDDHIDNLVAAKKSGKFQRLYLYDQPWNRHPAENDAWLRIHGIEDLLNASSHYINKKTEELDFT